MTLRDQLLLELLLQSWTESPLRRFAFLSNELIFLLLNALGCELPVGVSTEGFESRRG